MKTICMLSQRPGSTRAAFRDYYENSHSRLGSRYFPFAKYVRNHLVESSRETDFDVLTEFYFVDDAAPGALMAGPVGEIMSLDERKFMDQSLIRSALVQESLLAGPPRDMATPGTRRQMLMLNPDGCEDASFVAAVSHWGTSLAILPGVVRVSLDIADPQWAGAPSRFPWRAVLSLWLSDEAGATAIAPPPGVRCDDRLLVDVCESTPELLAELYCPSLD